MERLTAFGFRTGEEHAQLETLASFGRFPLPLRERAILTELDLMEKVYAGSDKANPDFKRCCPNSETYTRHLPDSMKHWKGHPIMGLWRA